MAAGRAVVGLESSVLAQGLPVPANAEAARRMVEAVERAGATAAITAVVAGVPSLGLTTSELEEFLRQQGIAKVSSRDLGPVMARRGHGATTVAAALTLCRAAGIPVLATGGIGGVHREPPYDESADLLELARSPLVVVCSGAKAILNVPATVERLETLGVTVVGYRTDYFPGFYYQRTDLRVPFRADTPGEVAAIFRAQRVTGHPGALLVVQPPPADTALSREDVERAVASALQDARSGSMQGGALTPYLLRSVEMATSGRSRSVNLTLLAENARLAAQLAVELGGSHLTAPNPVP